MDSTQNDALRSPVALTLESAIAQGNLTAVRTILDADPATLEQHFHDNCGLSPLMWACRRRHAAIVEELLGRGADVNARNRVEANGEGGNFALWFTANGNGHGLSIAKRLIKRGAEINLTGEFGQTALHQAAAWNNLEMALFLIQSGADVKAKTDRGETASLLASTFGFMELSQELQRHEDRCF